MLFVYRARSLCVSHIGSTILVVFGLFFFPPGISRGQSAELEDYVGSFGGVPISVSSANNYVSRRDCGDFGLAANIAKGSDAKTRELRLYKDFQGDGKDKVYKKITLTREKRIEHGIPTEFLSAHDVEYEGKKIDISLRRSLSLRYWTWTSGFGACADAGWSSGYLLIAVEPKSWGRLSEWAKLNDSEIVPDLPFPFEAQNVLLLAVPSGSEYSLIAELQKQSWVLDVRREGVEAGPDNATVDFPLDSVITKDVTQTVLKEKLAALLKDTFPGLKEADGLLSARKGLSYSFAIYRPALEIEDGDKEYNGYWLKATVDFDFSQQLRREGDAYDRVEIGIQDGWLPRWPDNRTDAPPDSHTTQYHLSPDGSDKFSDFHILGKLQEKIANAVAAKWNGEANIPDFQ
ncbi:MAG: hypothetical protein E5V92_17925 [Mesorhizobium sp.]|uniref:hypothetical protein n=1 Tax=unclassified Mesorhizobium TaxID=325217 RepID=UPI000F74CD61|nr:MULTISPECIES: hypothetical protein [unclassified Mesorhizobium]AZO74160.1 hypothetical protein EJ067_25700 [Mesorhizobium sp. M1D.F.Ca.ET.043.01.1.1]RWA80352.1 MAG: hypothetical protein EOQ32_31320 [Mesorhizobium sp.]RWE16028.1 MAG: hypothetical protein EOS61_07815 [Mesorhizobium sp.]TJW83574.1 MAG: hypothetical protein E5V92_17925 [Mesorhizobium sp.]